MTPPLLDVLETLREMDEAAAGLEELITTSRFVFEVYLVALAEGRTEDLSGADDFTMSGSVSLRAELDRCLLEVARRLPRLIRAWERQKSMAL